MPLVTTLDNLIRQAKEKRSDAVEILRKEVVAISQTREEQIHLSQEERSKLNFLAFAIVGAVLGFSPISLQNIFVISGLAILLFNAFLFGYVADCCQRNSNIKNCDDALKELREADKPYAEAYDAIGRYIDDPSATPQGLQTKFNAMMDAAINYMDWRSERGPRIAKKTRLGIGYMYFVLFALGLAVTGAGLVLDQGGLRLNPVTVSSFSSSSSNGLMVDEREASTAAPITISEGSTSSLQKVILQNATKK
ncbi:MAG: hypothetical protein PHN33_02715 [Candidatus Peribacteraceae bacterium]|nr:hypothetical protein [Candidatus Peribacteraceae bacterium]